MPQAQATLDRQLRARDLDRMGITKLGATVEEGGVRFLVWAPNSSSVDVVIEDDGTILPMRAANDGYFETFVSGLRAGTRYKLRMNGQPPMPDPASRFQPEGIHGPSEVIDTSSLRLKKKWSGKTREELVFYELHVGTFSARGDYKGVIEKLPYLRDLGITAIELLPLAEFPGRWNWGYDPAAFFAPSRAYGRPEELVELIDAAHEHGMAVFLDVVYNHFGPDGSYIVAFAPQVFTDEHQTPWGRAINLDGDRSEPVRRFLRENALAWLGEYGFDGLRLDAIFALIDDSPKHFLAELSEAVAALPGPTRHLIGEDHRNERRVLEPRDRGGYGLDGVWSDDFHHQTRVILAGDREAWFRDFEPVTEDLAKCLQQGWLYTGQKSRHHREPRGTPTEGIAPSQIVSFIQNHDQIGNRPAGERLNATVALPEYRAISSLLLFAPELPLLFMGQEWAATTPWMYFTDHEPELGKKVTEGRKQEFGGFSGFSGEVPDPQDPQTFEKSKLDWSEVERAPHKGMLALYRDLLALRKRLKNGEWRVSSPVEGAIVAERGSLLLVVALKPDVRLTLPDNVWPVWHSEQAPYAVDPMPPEVADGEVVFPKPAALRLERAPG